jgi:hypothetical protein
MRVNGPVVQTPVGHGHALKTLPQHGPLSPLARALAESAAPQRVQLLRMLCNPARCSIGFRSNR